LTRGGAPRLALALLAASSLAAAPMSPAWAQPRAAGLRPLATTDEGGLWSASDKAEAAARTKAELNSDPALTGYVRGVACKVAAEYCGDIRVYVMDRPFFNAQMAPNGYMEVWSGLLLRVTDESELAFVLGHETSHFAHQHSLVAWRTAKARGNAALALTMVVAAAGVAASAGADSARAAQSISDTVGAVTDVIYLIAIASLFAFSRDQEEEADRLGFERAVASGYAPASASSLWRSLQAETASSDFPRVRKEQASASIFASHPVTVDRVAALDTLAKGRAGGADTGRARYRAAIRPHLSAWLKDDLRRRDYGQTLHLIDRLAADGEDLGVLNFYRGEAFRRRRGGDDATLALEAYVASSKSPDAPVAVWREIGDLRLKAGHNDLARVAYETYLAKAPTAQDRWLVEANLKKLTGTSAS
jgi:predicted Zn-dependent protease